MTAQRGSGDGLGGEKSPKGLTKNERLVWQVLAGSHEPRKAYEILDRLKAEGVRAPMTVYRALDGLEAKGLVHKLDALNAYVLCNHDDGPHEVEAFLVCDACPTVREVEIDMNTAGFIKAVMETGFTMSTARLEVHGCCADCSRPIA